MSASGVHAARKCAKVLGAGRPFRDGIHVAHRAPFGHEKGTARVGPSLDVFGGGLLSRRQSSRSSRPGERAGSARLRASPCRASRPRERRCLRGRRQGQLRSRLPA
ncbi:hypothetical protein ARTSIC4J27_228 [Pseudarthrobacter siccitolerans]|uniref:Uncharacterized protein n=1 Tax=Pseudarthrobacter siccitolerans TaxID=861266 RepID=A0A024GXS7_9MICC|nr:hypothetical protein ARTSIC4J27_228 [Pseudarthrobacter siccitolerans]